MLGGDVRFLAGVLLNVEELVIDETVLMTSDGEIFPLVLVGFGAGFPAGLVCEEVAVGPS